MPALFARYTADCRAYLTLLVGQSMPLYNIKVERFVPQNGTVVLKGLADELYCRPRSVGTAFQRQGFTSFPVYT